MAEAAELWEIRHEVGEEGVFRNVNEENAVAARN